jgi:hypothetical protein
VTEKWWKSDLFRLITRLYAYTFVALFAAGFLLTAAARFDETRINEVIVDGVVISRHNDDVRLGVLCKGHDMGFAYDVRLGQLTVYSGTQAVLLFKASQSLSSMFPVTKEELVLAAGLLGGSAGIASLFERVRLAAIEPKVRSYEVGFVNFGRSRKEESKFSGLFFNEAVLISLGIAGAAVTAAGGGYYVGKVTAESLGLDVDCSSKRLQEILQQPATWRNLLGTVFTHAYANLLDCVRSGQLRTAMVGGAIDYADAPYSEAVGRKLSLVDNTLIRNLTADPDRKCGSDKMGPTIEGTDGEPSQTILRARYPGCWTVDDVAKALEARKVSREGPLSDGNGLAQRIIKREFDSASGVERAAVQFARPSPADGLAKAMERLGKGRLINEKGEASIGIDDLMLLLETKARVRQSNGCKTE